MGTKAFVKGLEGSWYRKECAGYVLAKRTHLKLRAEFARIRGP